MSVTLAEIWAASVEQLQPILQTQNRTSSSNLNTDRNTVAIIYYNAGTLTGHEIDWVAHPNFITVMKAAPTLAAGLRILKQPLIVKIIQLYGMMDVAWSAAGSNAWDAAGYAAGYTAALVTASVAGDIARDTTQSTIRAIAWKIARAATTGGSSQGIAREAWRAVVGLDTQIGTAVSTIPYEDKSFDPIAAIVALLNINLEVMVPIARCFYIWSLWDILTELPPISARDELHAHLQTLVDTYGCGTVFSEVPIIITTGLSPLIGKLAAIGGAEAISDLIGQYATRPPTRAEVMQRLLTSEV